MQIPHPHFKRIIGDTRHLPIHIDPPLLNSANPWATTLEDIEALFRCKSTGAVTTRTALLDGFGHDDSIHQYAFFNPSTHEVVPRASQADTNNVNIGSLNTLGYSPLPLAKYLDIVRSIDATCLHTDNSLPAADTRSSKKPIIISVTGSPSEVRQCRSRIAETQKQVAIPLLMEVNLSCPNIADKPPPAYSGARLKEYLDELATDDNDGAPFVPVGLKVPPYTYADQFAALVDALSDSAATCRVDFITATNTLGSSLVLAPQHSSSAGEDESGVRYANAIESSTGMGIGGLAGAPLHPLALGNVMTLFSMLDLRPRLRHIWIIGVGGVGDADGYRRMRAVGAGAVGVGTALGRKGVGVFDEILGGLEGEE